MACMAYYSGELITLLTCDYYSHSDVSGGHREGSNESGRN